MLDCGAFVRSGDYQVEKGLSFSEITVKVDSFYSADFVVTQREWNEVMDYNPSHFRNDDLPIECVGWHEAVLFCNKKSEKMVCNPVIKPAAKPWNAILRQTVIACRRKPNGNLQRWAAQKTRGFAIPAAIRSTMWHGTAKMPEKRPIQKGRSWQMNWSSMTCVSTFLNVAGLVEQG